MKLNETINLTQKVYNTKTGKNPLLIYIDTKTSTDNTYELKDKLKEYGMEYLPSKLGKYAPHSWGWILWNGENDKQMSYVRKFIDDIPSIESAGEDGERGFGEITGELEKTVQEILKSISAAEKIQSKSPADEETKKRLEDFKNMLQNELGNEKTQEFVKALIMYRAELRKHNMYNLSWTNIMLAYFSRDGKATQIRPLKEWEKMGYEPKENIPPIKLIGKNSKHIKYTPQQKERIISDYLAEKGVDRVEDLPQSSQYDLYNRRLKGRVIPGTEYQFTYDAYDVLDVQPIKGANIEKEPDEPDTNWWWDKASEDEIDKRLTKALIEFASSDECGNLTIDVTNPEAGLGGARGNATNTGTINLINDDKMKFPTAVHELTHQLRHWEFASGNNPALKKFYGRNQNRDIREQEAELCAAYVCAVFNKTFNAKFDLQPHLNYVFNWGLGKENCAQVLDNISEVANFIEKGVRKYLGDDNQQNNA